MEVWQNKELLWCRIRTSSSFTAVSQSASGHVISQCVYVCVCVCV